MLSMKALNTEGIDQLYMGMAKTSASASSRRWHSASDAANVAFMAGVRSCDGV
jgi:hypothetical protein